MLTPLIVWAAAVLSSLSPCEKQPSMVAVRRCAAAEMKSYGSKVDALVAERRKQLDRKDWPDFDAAQTSWEAYRAATCRSATVENEGGAGRDAWESECWSARAKDRIRELRRLIDGCEAQQAGC